MLNSMSDWGVWCLRSEVYCDGNKIEYGIEKFMNEKENLWDHKAGTICVNLTEI